MNRKIEAIDGQIGRSVDADERAAAAREFLEVDDALLADAAHVLRWGGVLGPPLEDAPDAERGQDNAIVSIAQAAGADLGIMDRRILKLEVIEHEARPTLVHAGGPGLIERRPRLNGRRERRLHLFFDSR